MELCVNCEQQHVNFHWIYVVPQDIAYQLSRIRNPVKWVPSNLYILVFGTKLDDWHNFC